MKNHVTNCFFSLREYWCCCLPKHKDLGWKCSVVHDCLCTHS